VRGTLVVIGDVMLDVDVLTHAHRLVPDAAAPVLEEAERVERPGGAALAALLAARSGRSPVRLVGPVAEDDAGRRIRELLDGSVEVVGLPCAGETPVKTRLRARGQTVARLDRGAGVRPVGGVPDAVRAAVLDACAILVSDYGGGLTSDPSMRGLLTEAARRIPVVWDPHPRGSDPVPAVMLVTPNEGEASGASGIAAGRDVATARRQAEALMLRWASRGVVVTRGAQGALLCTSDGSASSFPAPAVANGDACGAGDCFAAAAASAFAAGALPSEAVAEAVAAATRFVASGGVAVLEQSGTAPTATGATGVEQVLASVRARGGTVVATGGCFDLLHAGHIQTLEAARSLGDCLVVCLNSDDSVRRLKGPSRPFQTVTDRARVLEAIRHVDAVAVFDEDTPVQLLRTIRPDIWVKGGDYTGAELPETELLRQWGGQVVTAPYLGGRSTSALTELARR
jgi:D-beta-D-heptose 7-phosphate kinase / D-beta-D-heptose 1-phosphate adenosyltransferase